MGDYRFRLFGLLLFLIYGFSFVIFYIKNAVEGSPQPPFDYIRPSRERPVRATTSISPLRALEKSLRQNLVSQIFESSVTTDEEIINTPEKELNRSSRAIFKTAYDQACGVISEITLGIARLQLNINSRDGSEMEKDLLLRNIKTFAEIIQNTVVPPVSATTKAAVRKPIPSFKTSSEMVTFFNKYSSNMAHISSSIFSRTQKHWREDLDHRAASICKSVAVFLEALAEKDPAKISNSFAQSNREISELLSGTSFSVLAHQSIASKDVSQASNLISLAVDGLKNVNKVEKDGSEEIEEVIKTAASVSAVMEKLAHALGNSADLSAPSVQVASSERGELQHSSSGIMNHLSMDFFLKAMHEFSVKLEERAVKAAGAITPEPSARDRVSDISREIRGAFVLLQVSIDEVSNESKLKKMIDGMKDIKQLNESGVFTPLPYLQLSAACNAIAENIAKLLDTVAHLKDLRRQESVRFTTMKPKKTTNIWERERGLKDIEFLQENGVTILRGGTFNQIVFHFLTTKDTVFVDHFILTLPGWRDPTEFIQKFNEFIQGPQNKVAEAILESTGKTLEEHRDHAMELLVRWVEEQSHVIARDTRNAVTELCKKEMSKETGPQKARRMYIAKRVMQSMRVSDITKLSSTIFDSSSLLSSMEKISCSKFIFQVPLEDIASQLTLLDHSIFASITNAELLDQCWNKDKTKHKAYHLNSMINRFNNVSLWAASLILWQYEPAERVECIQRFILLSEHLFNLKSYNSFFAIVAALQFTAINRILTKIFEGQSIQARKQALYNRLLDVMNPKGSFKQYRDLLNSVGDSPCVPFMGMYLTDLVFTDEGNIDFLDDNKVYINWQKQEMNGKIISKIMRAQKIKYDKLEINESLTPFLIELPHLHKDKLMPLSLLVQPREKAKV
ncbi:hypothetical protein PROFUN_01354 [Planoprotostelium fungivorum]|uniref:Ras guanine nucleotide exchange factor n=1 Tax=Planoprotostelium fungivorum TaxID=1890364 RepID=A0A2P6NZV6_9EUKA|nr:hypothetical protein PROFUN_01354 [Planoprotostelium fungivorum]